MKRLLSVSVMLMALAAAVVISPAAGATYDLTLMKPDSSYQSVSGVLFYNPYGDADNQLANYIIGYLGTNPLPSGNYNFAMFWYFNTDATPSPYAPPLAAGNAYALSWTWNDIKFGYEGLTQTLGYTAAYQAVAQEQTFNGDDYVLAGLVNDTNTYVVTGIFREGENLNIFGLMSADVPSGINLLPFMTYWAANGYNNPTPVFATGQSGSTASGTLEVGAVPIPGSLTLLMPGLVGLGVWGWRRRRQ
jgi:hypothetical protein